MNIRDVIFMLAGCLGIAGGLLLPSAAGLLEGYPRVSLMIMLFLSFLGLNTRDILREVAGIRKELAIMTIGKLILVPAVTFFIFQLIMPQYSLGVLLMAGGPCGVISAVFAMSIRADFTLALAGVVFTSLISPFTLPVLTSLALSFLGGDPTLIAGFSPFRMSLEMAMLIAIPFVLAQLVKATSKTIGGWLLQARFWLNAGTLCLCNIAIFARYSETLLQNINLLLGGLIATLIAWIIFFICGALLAWKWSLPKQISMGLTIGITNSVMAMILGIQFFSLNEVLPGAMFAVPTVLALIPCRLLLRLRTGRYELV